MGWMHPVIDSVVQDFLDLCEAQPGAEVLEIGAAYGYASLAALERGANAWVNDLDERHLHIFYRNTPIALRNRAWLVPGDFPGRVLVPVGHFDAILAVRVFHFFTPEKLRQAMERCYEVMRPGGQLHVVAGTPYVRSFSALIPLYEESRRQGNPFPGFITNASDYDPATRGKMPETFHLLDPEVLARESEAAGFIVRQCEFVARPDFPDRLRLDGRESVGLIAEKP